MPDNSQIRHETIVVRQGLVASDPQHVWQLAAQQAQDLAGADEQVVDVRLGAPTLADDSENSTDRRVPFTYHVLDR